MTTRRFELTLTGRVQGVGFRAFTERHAGTLGISGSVANQPDGSVRVEAEGPEEKLEEFINMLRLGPALSNVRELKSREMELRNDCEFRVIFH